MKTDSNYKNVDFSAWIGFENLLCVSKTWDAARARSGNQGFVPQDLEGQRKLGYDSGSFEKPRIFLLV